MTSSHSTWNDPQAAGRRVLRLGVLPVAATALALLLVRNPALALAGVAGVAVLSAMIRWPEASTLLVIFVLYTNAAGVAVEFQGVPYIVGAAFSLLLLIPLCERLIVRGERIVLTPVLPLILALVLVQTLGALGATEPDAAMRHVLSSLTEGIALYFLITNVVRTPQMVRRVVWVLVAAGAFMAAIPLYQMLTATYGNNYGGFAQVSNSEFEVGSRAVVGGRTQFEQSGSLGQQNYFAQMLLMLVPLALFRCWQERAPLLRLLAGAAACLTTIGVALTYSRGAALGLAVMLLAMIALRCIRLKHVAVLAAGAVLFLAVFPQYGSRLLRLQGLWGIVTAQATGEPIQADSSLESRATEVRSAAQVFFENPVLGVGPGMFKHHYQDHAAFAGPKAHAGPRGSHNLYLGMAAEHGLLGLGCFLAIVFVVMHRLVRRRAEWLQTRPDLAGLATAFLLALVTFLTAGMGLHLAFVRYFWLMLALASVVAWLPTDMLRRDGMQDRERLETEGA